MTYDPVGTDASGAVDARRVLLLFGIGLLTVAVMVVVSWLGYVALLNYLFPAVVLLIGGFLYTAFPTLYLGFLWWVWFVAPLVRRIVDLQVGWTDPSPILLTPYLLGFLTIFTLLPNLHRLTERRYFPFALVLLALVYGGTLGVIYAGLYTTVVELLQWMVPVLVGFHLALRWEAYPAHRYIVKEVFTWGVIFMGAYGVYQFLVLPSWDVFWMVNSGMESIGQPRPGAVRVFGTLNSPGPFSFAMMAGLLVLFTEWRARSVVAMAPAVLGFLLALVRSAWGGLAIAMGVMALRLTGQDRARLVKLLVLAVVTLLPLAALPEIAGQIGARAGTFTNLEGDTSFQARMASYQGVTLHIIRNPIGMGVGGLRAVGGDASLVDSGLLTMMVELGWLGAALYFFALVLIVLPLLRQDTLRYDMFAVTSLGIGIGMIAMMALSKMHYELGGALLWAFLGLAVAGGRHADAVQDEADAWTAYAYALEDHDA